MTPWERIVTSFASVKMDTTPPVFKICTLCNRELPLSEFYRNEHKIVSRCKPCYKMLVKQNRERVNEANRQARGLSAG